MAKKKSSTKPGRKNVSVPLTPDEHEALTSLADKEARSLGEQARVILKPALAKEVDSLVASISK